MYTVIITLFNKEKFILKTIKSVINQTIIPKEVIIVDDCSQDNGLTLVKNFICQYNGMIKMKIIENIVNRGVSYSRNSGLEYATGNYIVFLDADDELHKQYLEKINMLATKEKADIICVRRYYRKTNKSKPNLKLRKFGVKINDEFYKITNIYDLLNKHIIFGGSASTVVKKDLIKDIRFDIDECNFEDWLFYFTILFNNDNIKMYFINSDLVYINYLENSLSRKKINTREIQIPRVYDLLVKQEGKAFAKLRKKIYSIWFYSSLLRLNKKDIYKFYLLQRSDFKENFVLNKFYFASLIKLLMKGVYIWKK